MPQRAKQKCFPEMMHRWPKSFWKKMFTISTHGGGAGQNDEILFNTVSATEHLKDKTSTEAAEMAEPATAGNIACYSTEVSKL